MIKNCIVGKFYFSLFLFIPSIFISILHNKDRTVDSRNLLPEKVKKYHYSKTMQWYFLNYKNDPKAY